MKIFISGYTNKDSKGIYQLPVTRKEDHIHVGSAKNIAQIGSPTYLQKDGNLIFAINRLSKHGGITVFRALPNQERLEELETFLEPGASPAYIGIDRKKRLLFTANYHTAIISVFSYTSEGYLALLDQVKHTADNLGPKPEQKDGPHPHFFDETPAGNLVSCDLGNDCVDFYSFKAHHLHHLAVYHSQPGFGDRHLVFSKDGHYFYVVGELSSKVSVVKFDEHNWHFETIATYLTKPANWTKHNGAAAIKISDDARYIYISNRGNDSLVVFKVNDDHKLSLVQRISSFGQFPRDFNWDASEQYVVVANQNSDNATLYSRNKVTGKLKMIQKDIYVPEGTRVIFTE